HVDEIDPTPGWVGMKMVRVACGTVESLVASRFEKVDDCILPRRFDHKVQVFGIPYETVRGQGNATDHGIADSLFVEEVAYRLENPNEIHHSTPAQHFVLRRQAFH